VSSLSVKVSSNAASATAVRYTIKFAPSSTGALAAGTGKVTMSGPTGIFAPVTASNFVVVDHTSGTTSAPGSVSVASGGASATLTLSSGQAIAPGDSVEIDLYGVTNPAAPGSPQLSVSTSADTALSTVTYTILAALPVVSPAVALSTPAAGATAVEYIIKFNTSSDGRLPVDTYDPALSGTITLAGPPGTAFPSNPADYVVIDHTSHTAPSPAGSVSVSSGGNAATLTLSATSSTVLAGDSVEVDAFGVGNPAGGGKSLTVSTSSDTAASSRYSVAGAGGVSSPAVTLSSAAAEATSVEWAVAFKTSGSGGLVADPSVAPSCGTITLGGPSGTVFPSKASSYTVTDHTSGSSSSPGGVSVSGGGASVTLALSGTQPVAAGDSVEVDAYGVTNPSAPGIGKSLSVRTSSDTTPASVAFNIVATQPVAAPAIALSSREAGAANTKWSVTFATSSTGRLTSAPGSQGATITVAGPPGWFDPSGTPVTVYNFVVSDLTTGDVAYPDGVSLGPRGGQATLTLSSTQPVAPGDSVEVDVYGMTNPGAGSQSLTVSTSSDGQAVATFVVAPAKSVTGPSVSVTSAAAGATNVEYAVDFKASSGGALVYDTWDGSLSGTVTLAGPAGMFDPSGVAMTAYNFVVTDTTSGMISYPGSVVVSPNGASTTLSLSLGPPVSAGDAVQVDVYGVTNPSAGGQSMSASTSSDETAVSTGYQIAPAGSVDSPSVTLSSLVAGASGVTYAVTFDTSPTGGLASYGYTGSLSGAISLGASPGTDFSSNTTDYSITDMTTGQVGVPATVSVSTGGASVTITLSGGLDVAPGDQVEVDAANTVNSTATCAQSLTVSTSSDTAPAGTAFSLSCPPSSPGGLSAVSGNGQIALSWSAANGYGTPVTDYVIDEYQGATTTGTPTVIDTTSTSLGHTVNGLTDGSQYTFTVSAESEFGTGAAGGPLTVVAGLPAAPTGLSVSLGSLEATLSWTAPSGNGSPVTDYVVEEYQGGAVSGTPTAIDTGSSGTSATITALTAGLEYTFTVEAVNAPGAGPASASVTTIAESVPGPVAQPSASSSNGTVKLTWSSPASIGYSTITGYLIDEYVGASAIGTPLVAVVGATPTSYTVTGLTNGQEYTFTVEAVNALGNGAPSPAVQATPEPVAPSVPLGFNAVASTGQVKVTWHTPASNGGSPITGYLVFRSTTPGSFTSTPIATVGPSTYYYFDRAVTSGTTYYYVVEAANAIGDSPPTAAKSAVPL
jgi:hypothetical protein